jgi:hypothetical protein
MASLDIWLMDLGRALVAVEWNFRVPEWIHYLRVTREQWMVYPLPL